MLSVPPETDRRPRYTPDLVWVASAAGVGMWPVNRVVIHPPDSQLTTIRAGFIPVELQTAAGSRWYGFEAARIDSTLRAVVVGFPAADEVRSKWQLTGGQE